MTACLPTSGSVVLPRRPSPRSRTSREAKRLRFHAAGDDRLVDPLDGVLAEHLHQAAFGLRAEGEDHQAAGVAVEAMDGADAESAGRLARPARALPRIFRPRMRRTISSSVG